MHVEYVLSTLLTMVSDSDPDLQASASNRVTHQRVPTGVANTTPSAQANTTSCNSARSPNRALVLVMGEM